MTTRHWVGFVMPTECTITNPELVPYFTYCLNGFFFLPLMATQVVVGLRMGSKKFGTSLFGLLRGVNFKWEIICLGETHGTWWVLMEECICVDIVRSLAVCNVRAIVLRS